MEKTSFNGQIQRLTTLNNKKLGGTIPQLNMPYLATCRPDAPCRALCYCNRGHFRHAKPNHENRLGAYLESPDLFFNRIDLELTCGFYPFFRWHSSGDIVDDLYFMGMVEIAKRHHETRFLAFTKKYELINGYLDKGGEIPDNLAVLFSCWGKGWNVPNPHNLPCSHVRFGNAEFDSVIPSTAFECCGACWKCVQSGKGCWYLKRGESVVINKH